MIGETRSGKAKLVSAISEINLGGRKIHAHIQKIDQMNSKFTIKSSEQNYDNIHQLGFANTVQ